MKKLIFIFIIFNTFIFSKEHLVFFLGQELNTLTYDDDTNSSLKTLYTFGTEFSSDLGENFELGFGIQSTNLTKIDSIPLTSNDKFFPTYFRLEAKTSNNENFYPYIFITYGLLLADFTYTNNSTSITAKNGTCKSIGLGVTLQNSVKIEVYTSILTNNYEFLSGVTKNIKIATTNITGLKIGYMFK